MASRPRHKIAQPRCLFSDLPEDLQTVIFEIVDSLNDQALLNKLKIHSFAIREVPISVFPRIPASDDYRDDTYRCRMSGKLLPPVILCGDRWLDGRNRVCVWRAQGRNLIPCVDLQELGVSYRSPCLGELARER